jgi:nucleoside-diphosphate-sugar epimerase
MTCPRGGLGASISRAAQELGWRAATGLAEGISNVCHWIEAGADDRTAG